jgi:hypothetical protein
MSFGVTKASYDRVVSTKSLLVINVEDINLNFTRLATQNDTGTRVEVFDIDKMHEKSWRDAVNIFSEENQNFSGKWLLICLFLTLAIGAIALYKRKSMSESIYLWMAERGTQVSNNEYSSPISLNMKPSSCSLSRQETLNHC